MELLGGNGVISIVDFAKSSQFGTQDFARHGYIPAGFVNRGIQEFE
jgi:hypothetical protein